MKKKYIYGIVLLIAIVALFTGCDNSKEKQVLTCVNNGSNDSKIAVYGESTITATVEFDKDGKNPKKATTEVKLTLNQTDVEASKMELIRTNIVEVICGPGNDIPVDNCDSEINGNSVTFKGTGDFTTLWSSYSSDNEIGKIRDFFQNQQEMTCSIKEVK